jgi:hypothetical protein
MILGVYGPKMDHTLILFKTKIVGFFIITFYVVAGHFLILVFVHEQKLPAL